MESTSQSGDLPSLLGFVPLPLGYFALLVVAVGVYLALAEIVKRQLMARLVM